MMEDHARPDSGKPGITVSPRMIVGILIAVVLIVFIASNRDTVTVEFLVLDLNFPLWLTLAITAGLGFLVGMMFGGKRQKRRMRARM